MGDAGAVYVFVSTRDGNSEIYVMNADGTGQERLTAHAATDTMPVWSPDGSTLAFTTNRHGAFNFEIYSMNADGTGLKRLTNHPAFDIDPTWSSAGNIAFVSTRTATSRSTR